MVQMIAAGHVPLALWVYGNELRGLRYRQHAWIYPFQAEQYLVDRLDFGRFRRVLLIEPTQHGVQLCPWT